MPARNHIDLTVKTMSVLESLVQSAEGASLKDIALRLGLIKSSVFRILFTLKELGYVEQVTENGLYRLTFKTTGLVRRSIEGLTLSKLARPHLVRLRDRVQESVWLAEQRRYGIVLIDVVEASHRLKLSFDVGDLCPVHATAVGKAIAAYLAPDQVEELLPKGRLPQLTSRTLTSRAQLKAELVRVRQQEYAINAEETIKGAILVGAPLFDSLGRVFAGISVSAPTARCSLTKRREIIEQVLAASRAITHDLRDAAFKTQPVGNGSGDNEHKAQRSAS
jgi:DNA-binding IclR family transcriptional regulator